MFSSSGTIVYTASGNEVKMWDLIGGGRLLHTFSNHQKNITGLCTDGTGSKLLSCGLDGLVKIYNMQSLQVAHGLKIGSPLSSIAVAPDNGKLVLGYVDGTLHVRTRQLKTGELLTQLHESDEYSGNLETSTQRRFFKGAGAAVEKTDEGMLETERAVKLRPYEIQLKKFNYQAALDAALKTRNPLVVITVIEELSRRSGLGIALAGRDENTLEPILSFAARYVSKAKFSKLIIQVVQKILDLYGQVLNHSDAIFELFLKLQEQVKTELKFQRQIMNVMGRLDCIINLSTLPIQTTNMLQLEK
jgi:U3 small nucleolar RNA-associated protein 15